MASIKLKKEAWTGQNRAACSLNPSIQGNGNGTPTKRPVSKRPVSNVRFQNIRNVRFSKPPVYKTYVFQNVKTPLTASCRKTSIEHNKRYAALLAVLSVKRNIYFGEKD
jgi:hypothetical protein